MTHPSANQPTKKGGFTLKNFIHDSRSVGILLLICTVISLVITNIGSIGQIYSDFWHLEFSALHHLHLPHSVIHIINDGLMAFFFFQVGMEIKREATIGELSSPSRMMLPTVAAASGVIFPALTFLILTKGTIYQNGWAIPTATDIAFSLGILSLLGKAIPHTYKVFLTALAIIDDLCAILIIAFFYGEHPHFEWLAIAAVLIGIIYLIFKKMKSSMGHSLGLLLGVGLWYAMYRSGIHATFAGVLLSLLLPIRKIHHYEKKLLFPVNFMIIPLFALANTSIFINSNSITGLTSGLSIGIILGLLLGKPIGISLAVFGLEKAKLVRLEMKNRMQFIGVTILAGIGFTMSIFVSVLAFEGDTAVTDIAKLAVLIASTLSMIIGYVWLRATSRKITIKASGTEMDNDDIE